MAAITSAAPASLAAPIVSPKNNAEDATRCKRDGRGGESGKPSLHVRQTAIP